jgi:membrane protein insertase Oxa1/YidC/SpoIIIJ
MFSEGKTGSCSVWKTMKKEHHSFSTRKETHYMTTPSPFLFPVLTISVTFLSFLEFFLSIVQLFFLVDILITPNPELNKKKTRKKKDHNSIPAQKKEKKKKEMAKKKRIG